MHHFITGAAGFIGSHLVDALLMRGDRVSGVDDYSLGRPENLAHARQNAAFAFYESDVSHVGEATECLRAASAWGGVPDTVWHLAANSDIAAGANDASIDFKRTLQTTFAVLAATKSIGAKQIAFASTSAVYGELDTPLAEDSGPLLPISNYGAMKLGSEALLSAACESFLERIWILRFPNVVGSRATHGALFDFVNRLAGNPNSLKVLGDGSQTKPYLYVSELIAAMEFIVAKAQERRNVFNVAPEGEGTSVAFIAAQLIERLRRDLPIVYTGGNRGWVGDVPRVRFNTEKLKSLGWRPELSSDEAVLRAIEDVSLVHA